MSLKIESGELHMLTDRFVIKTRCPRDLVTLEMVQREVLRATLAAGDTITVQCMSHDREVLLHEAEFRVVLRKDVPKQTENPRGDIHYSQAPVCEVQQATPWWATVHGQASDKAAADKAEAEAAKPGGKKAAA